MSDLRRKAASEAVRSYMVERMAMRDFETDQMQNWIFGHMAAFADALLDAVEKATGEEVMALEVDAP